MRTILIAFLAVVVLPVYAQPVREERVQFEAGTTLTMLSGQITGDEIVDYFVDAAAGQRMAISFSTSNSSAYFNLIAGDDPAALHIGSSDGGKYDGTLIRSGNYRVRVYLTRNAARRGETAEYTLSVAIDRKPAPNELARAPLIDDGLQGGPDFWEVYRVSSGRLNIRSGPGLGHDVIGQITNGDTMSNLGCEMVDTQRWCNIGDSDRTSIGWVSGDYLREAVGPLSGTASGIMPCALRASQPKGRCGFRVTRGGGGTAAVWVDLPDGGERFMDFRDGKLVGSDPGLLFTHERIGDLNLVSIDGDERYEFPDAVLYGG